MRTIRQFIQTFIFTTIALLSVSNAQALVINFVTDKTEVSVGEEFTISVIAQDIIQDPSATDVLVDAFYQYTFNQDLLDFVDFSQLPELGLTGWNYLGQQSDEVSLLDGSVTTTSESDFEYTGDFNDLLLAQVVNNPNDFFTIETFTFVATAVGMADFSMVVSEFEVNNDFFAPITRAFTVNIVAANNEVSTPAVMSLLTLALIALFRARTKQ